MRFSSWAARRRRRRTCRAIALKPEYLEARVNRAHLRAKIGDAAGAAEDLAVYLRAAPADHPSRRHAMEILRKIPPQVRGE